MEPSIFTYRDTKPLEFICDAACQFSFFFLADQVDGFMTEEKIWQKVDEIANQDWEIQFTSVDTVGNIADAAFQIIERFRQLTNLSVYRITFQQLREKIQKWYNDELREYQEQFALRWLGEQLGENTANWKRFYNATKEILRNAAKSSKQ